jgi:hypothetical protein
MFCPKCKAEYRFGFTHCADCDVDLVESLDAPTDRPPGDDLSAPVLLWSGFHTGTLEEIRAALDEAEVAYNDEPLEARLLYASMRHPLEIWVQKADFDAAKKLVAKRLTGDSESDVEVDGLESNPKEHPDTGVWEQAPLTTPLAEAYPDFVSKPQPREATEVEDSESEPENEIPEQPYDPAENAEESTPQNPEDEPSIEVWTGTESEIADYVAMCFREDSIRFARFPDTAGGIRILVFPDREERARLIVREVVDGKLPE